MQILQKIKNPLIWILGLIIKLILRKLFFNNISNDDFKRLFSYTLELLPNETFISILKLLINTFTSKPSDILNFRLLNEAVTHSIPQDQRLDILGRLRFLFIFLMLGNVFKRSLFLFKSIILLPFKLGVYGYLASLIGFRPDYLLSFFDTFKFNLPAWTYQKLVDLHISWMTWFKNHLQIKSLTTGLEDKSSIPSFKRPSILTEPEPIVEVRPETYFYLTKTQWIYLSISAIFLVGAYFGYTGGIPFQRSWESDSDGFDFHSSNTGSNQGDIVINRGVLEAPETTIPPQTRRAGYYLPQVPGSTWYESIKTWPGKLISKINPYSRDYLFNRETPEIIVNPLPAPVIPTDPREAEAYYSERLTGKLAGRYSRMEPYIAPEQKPWHNFISRLWTKDNIAEQDALRIERLKKLGLGHMYDSESGDLKYEHKPTNNTSPTPSDPDSARDRDRLFVKPRDNSTAGTSSTGKSLPKDSFYSFGSFKKFTALDGDVSLYSASGANDSTETITQTNVLSRDNTSSNTDNFPTDTTASELQPLTRPVSPPVAANEPEQTFPPRPKGKQRVISYFPGSDSVPFARGFTENIDINSLNKGSVILGSQFLDNIDKDKDNFNGDWNK